MPRWHPQCFGHAGVADRSLHRVQAGDEFRSFRHRLLQTSSGEALVSVTLPYILGIAGRGLEEAVTERPELLSGLNTVQGSVCHPGVAKALGVPPRHPMACLR